MGLAGTQSPTATTITTAAPRTPQSALPRTESHSSMSQPQSQSLSQPPASNSTAADTAASDLLSVSTEWSIPPEELTLGPEIGRGFFGLVHRGVWNGQQVAVKKMYRALPRGEAEMLSREIKIMSSLRSPFIVLFMGVCTTDADLLIVSEFLERGSLHHALRSEDGNLLSLRKRVEMMADVARGMSYLHGRCADVVCLL